MLKLILNDDHLLGALGQALAACRHRLFIATADVKELHVPIDMTAADKADDDSPRHRPAARRLRRGFGRDSRSILDVFQELSGRGVEIRLLHGAVPSGPFLGRLKEGMPPGLSMRRCVRMHAKAVIVDGRWMYMGSANLTGAGLGAKSARRRNFEAGVWTDQLELIDPLADMLEEIWNGSQCRGCGRKKNCPVPLEEPQL